MYTQLVHLLKMRRLIILQNLILPFIFHHCFSHSEIDLNIYITFMRFLKYFSEIFTWLPLHLTKYSVCVVGSEDLCEDLREPQGRKRKKMRYRVFWSWRDLADLSQVGSKWPGFYTCVSIRVWMP